MEQPPSPLHNQEALFSSLLEAPHYQALGIQLRHYGRGVASARLNAQPSMLGSLGTIEPGILMALGGFACRAAVLTLLGPGREVAPLEQRISLLSPISEGSLIAKARVEHQRARLAQCHFRIIDENEESLATGGCTIYILQREQRAPDLEGAPASPPSEATPNTEMAPQDLAPFRASDDDDFDDKTSAYDED